jgi:four helix bundle protein
MGEIKSFEDLIVWQKAHRLFLEVARDIEVFPNGRTANVIANQLLRSAGSISANIAEGFGRRMGKEYLHV